MAANKKKKKKPRFEKKGTKEDYKTDTIMNRAILVYLPSIEMKNQWSELAKTSDTSTSKFIIEHVNNSLDSEKDSPSINTRVKLIEDNQKLKEENAELLKQIREQDSHIEMLEREARSHVIEPFLEPDFGGIRQFSTRIIDLFKKEREIPKEELYKKLRINPMDTDATTAIQKHIEIFEQYGFLKDIGGKWRWKV